LRTVVSHDAKTMTTTGKGTDADGKAMTLTLGPREAVEQIHDKWLSLADYMIQISYSAAAWAALIAKPQNRLVSCP
jgi:hypothetical protein